MKILVEKNTDSTDVRKLTKIERTDRYKKQIDRLSGSDIKDFLEPFDALIDLTCTQYDNNRLSYMPWEKYTRRAGSDEQEKDQKKDPMLTVDISSGKFKLEKKKDDVLAEINSDLKIQYIFQRRIFACDQTNITKQMLESIIS